MQVYLTLEDKVINLPPDALPAFYTDNKWRLVFSESLGMYVTQPPLPPAPKDDPI